MRGEKINLLKATRIYRVIPTLMIILLASSFNQKFNIYLLFLSLISILIYASGGIQNAIKDKDYDLPKKSKIIIFCLIGLALIISLTNKTLFLTTIIWVSLSFIYNTISRKIILGDTIIMSLTHYVIPFVSATILLHSKIDILFTSLLFLTFFFLTPFKNIKDTKQDKQRGYKTLTTTFAYGKDITLTIFFLLIIPLSCFYLFFKLNLIYLIGLVIVIFLDLLSIKNNLNLSYARILLNFIIFNLIFGFSKEPTISLSGGILLLISTIISVKSIKETQKISYKT